MSNGRVFGQAVRQVFGLILGTVSKREGTPSE